MRQFKRMDKGILTDIDMKSGKYRVLYYVMLAILILICLVTTVPVIWILLSGFKEPAEMYAVPASFFPKEIRLSKLLKVWNEMKFYNYYSSTLVMALGSAASTLIICGLAGYVLSRLKPRGSRLVLAGIFWLMLMPGNMRTVPLYMTFKDFPILHISLLDTFVPIWIMAAAHLMDIILFKNFFDSISNSLIEAAKIDGASNLSIFFKIVVPLSVPVFIVVGIFSVNGQLGQFFWPYLLITDKKLTVLGVQLYKMRSGNYTMDYQMLSVFFTMVPQLLIFSVFQKQIMGGINIGGLKE